MTSSESERGQGRKIIDGAIPMEVYPIRVSIRQARKARKIGNGNMSAGFRIALDAFIIVIEDKSQ